jgi:hypothetical protein
LLDHDNSINIIHAFLFRYLYIKGHAVAQLVEALYYKPEGRGFYSR